MHFSVITLFPEMFDGILTSSIIKRAIERKKLHVNLLNLRDFGIGKHKTVDDKPYGGGAGMVLRVDVLHKAIQKAVKEKKETKIILLDPRGIPFTQSVAEKLSKEKSIILVCGHYEGFDERIREFSDMEISLGDFVLTGGEIPAMAIIDSVARLIPGVLGHRESSLQESFSKRFGKRLLEHPHYTRPKEYKYELKTLKVPEILLSGDHKRVEEERLESSKRETLKKRPDLLS